MSELTPKKHNAAEKILRRIATIIVDGYLPIFLLFLVAGFFCVLTMGKVKVNSDLTFFLPSEAETRKGLEVMAEEYANYGAADVMVVGITSEEAQELQQSMLELRHVASVNLSFADSESNAGMSDVLFSIGFDESRENEEAVADMTTIRELLEQKETYINTDVGNSYHKKLAKEMVGIMLIAVLVILAVLLFTSRSYFEIVVYTIAFAVAALLNMGTNYWIGEISSITNSIAVIMQLALAIDYAIIFSHRYQNAAQKESSTREALITSLMESIVEIASSSLTTISGLLALTMMQFRLGYDLGVVLSKGIVCSMLTVFLLMPGLIRIFSKPIRKTIHKNLVPNISGFGRFLMKGKGIFAILFILAIPGAIIFSHKVSYSFSDETIDELVMSEQREAMHKIIETFHPGSSIAVLVPEGNFDAEREILGEVAKLPEITGATGLAGIMLDESHSLTDRYTPQMIAGVLNVDIEQVNMLYMAYAMSRGELVLNQDDLAGYEAPLADLLICLFDLIDQGLVPLTGEQAALVDSLRGDLERGYKLLRGNTYDRLVFSSTAPAEGKESVELVDRIREISQNHYEDEVLVIGDITSSRDLKDSYLNDSIKINILTIVFVFVILLFTFKSPIVATLLVFVIQGSIWINFACTYIADLRGSFVTGMIVSAIQMGATIDYAIVIMNHYRELRKEYDKKEAMVHAVNESFPTVITSGSIMTLAGFLIAYRVSDVYVGHIGLAVGRGALISMILVLTVLPQLLVFFDPVKNKKKKKQVN